MLDRFSRTELLFGKSGMDKLKNARVAVFGAGGVGGYVLEALARAGIGAIDIIDNDTVSESNINRQIIAVQDTVGRLKTDVAEERILQINPECRVRKYNIFFLPETAADIDFFVYDYVVDAIDTVTGKKEIIIRSKQAEVPVISSMGTGNKVDPTLFRVADIYETSVCPLARVMRGICRKNNIKDLKVVYSQEKPLKPDKQEELSDEKNTAEKKREIPGSVSFVPSVAGLIIAGEVIKDIIGFKRI